MRSYLPTKLVLFLAILFSINTINAQSFVYEENEQSQGFQIESSSKSAVILKHAIHNFQLTDIEVEGENMKQLQYGLSIIPSSEGAPDLQSVGRYILIPNGAQAKINILSEEIVSYQNIDIAPAAAIPFDTEEAIPAVKGSAYQKNAFFPTDVYQSTTTEVRGMTLAMISISPFQYNPMTKELVVRKNIEIEVQILGGDGSYGQNRFRSRYWDQILDDLVLNTQDIPIIDYSKQASSSKDENGCDYLIIVPNNDDFLPWADSIKLFRTEQGIDTKIVTLDEIGGNSLDNIKNFVNEVYETYDPVPAGVLLMADYGSNDNTITSKTYPHPYQGNYITDNYYADYTGNDLPDFVFARMTGRDANEFEIMVHKFIEYERNPPVNEDFYNKPITALGWQTERWFQICSETVGGYMLNVLGKEPVRINAVYGGNPNVDPWSTAQNTNQVVSYFGPTGRGYIPASPSELGGWTGGSASDVVNALNDGAFILQHRDHGSESGWGEPAFQMSHINQLNNVDELSHIFSINCLTGRFDVSGECFAEKFHRYDNGGALSLTAASQVSYSFVNDAFVWGMYDNMWPDFMPDYGGNLIPEREFRPAFGSASGKYFLSYTNWPYNEESKQVTYRLFHHHGDAFNIVFTEVPQEMDIAYSDVVISGPDVIEVQAEEGALIAFSVDGELIGVGEGTGTAIDINFQVQDPGTIIKVVVTKQNYFRHEGSIQVIAPDGPYIVKSGIEIDDAAGNNNGLADYSEDILLDFSITNLGTELASDITVSITSDDEYINITDSDENFGDIDVNEEVTHVGAFAFSINDFIPDNHNISFGFVATNGTDIWESSFSIKAYAPELEILSMDVEEVNGNGNGRVDAGEDAIISIEIENTGHSATVAGLAEIISSSEYLIINTAEFSFDVIDGQEMIIAEFEVSTDEDTPIGTVIDIINNVEAGEYTANKEFYFSVGLIVEDWETGDFSQFDWQFAGSAEWIIDNSEAYEGDNSARSEDIGDGQQVSLVLNYESSVDDHISFFYKVSSESGYDKLKFYIDGSEKGSWDGEVSWTEASYDVAAGTHIFKWTYSKDGSVSNGQDCAWVDFIIFPPMLMPSSNAGDDAEICNTEDSYQLSGSASDFDSYEWSTTGDGIFSDINIFDPVYTVGANDVSNEQVDLTLTVIGGDHTVSNTMTLRIVDSPVQPEVPQGAVEICYLSQDVVYTLDNETYSYEWYITPENAATIVVNGNNAYLSFNEGFNGEAQLSAMAYNACGESAVSEALILNVFEQATVAFTDDAETCAGVEVMLSLELTGNAPWTVEIMDDDGAEIFVDIDSSPYEIMVNPTHTVNYTLMNISDVNNCNGFANGSAQVIVNELPTGLLSAESVELCAGDIVEVNLELTGVAPWIVTLSDGADEEQIFEVDEANETVEFIAPLHSMELQFTSIIDDNGCNGDGEGSVAISVKESPNVDLGQDTTICNHMVYSLDAQSEGSTYLWSTGETTQTIEVDESLADDNGDVNISVEVTNPTGCFAAEDINIHFKDCTGVDELAEQDIQLMPNPNNGLFKLELEQINKIQQLTIHNSLGEIVASYDISEIQQQMDFNLSHLADGVYFLSIHSQSNTVNKRFIIRK